MSKPWTKIWSRLFFPMWYLLDTEKKKIEERLFEEHIKNMMQIHYA
jgi:hypothetical protein